MWPRNFLGSGNLLILITFLACRVSVFTGRSSDLASLVILLNLSPLQSPPHAATRRPPSALLGGKVVELIHERTIGPTLADASQSIQ